jgi:hypothetical protein
MKASDGAWPRSEPDGLSDASLTGLLGLADRIAEAAHQGQLDKAGAAYIGHPRRVAQQVAARGGTDEQQAAALLHDVLEDIEATPEQLRTAGIPDVVIEAVIALTKVDGESYEQAVERAASDRVARLVKRCDIEDNTDPERLALLDPHTRQRLVARYRSALAILDRAQEPS